MQTLRDSDLFFGTGLSDLATNNTAQTNGEWFFSISIFHAIFETVITLEILCYLSEIWTELGGLYFLWQSCLVGAGYADKMTKYIFYGRSMLIFPFENTLGIWGWSIF